MLCTGHLGGAIETFAGDGSAFGIRLRYSRDGGVPLGTGGALVKALPLLDDPFLVLYGDTYPDCNVRDVVAAFTASGRLGMLTVATPPHARYHANISVRGDAVALYHKTRRDPAMDVMYWGLGVFRRAAFAPFDGTPVFDLGDAFIDLVARHELGAVAVDRRHYEIGCPEGLAETDALLAG